ncbi:MAG: hypothetical protein K2X03_25535 [Bryobacteraceae bacterium]|nr:hypothetical protein [Bryobacteraceae bacterium]
MRYCLSSLTVTGLLFAQAQFRKVDPTLTLERVIAIVPMLGTGSGKDAKRPQFSHLPGITGFTLNAATMDVTP